MKLFDGWEDVCVPAPEFGENMFRYRPPTDSQVHTYRLTEHCANEKCGQPHLAIRKYMHGVETFSACCSRECFYENYKMSEAGLIKSRENGRKTAAGNVGKKKSPESIEKTAAAHRGKIVPRDVVLKQALTHSLPGDEAAFNDLYNSYVQGAKSRDLEFSLSKAQFKLLTKMNCIYCGTPPSAAHVKHRVVVESAVYIFTGIDRLTPSLGYTVNNVVPCCHTCNVAKMTRTAYDFLIWAQQIYEFSASRLRDKLPLVHFGPVLPEHTSIAHNVYTGEYKRSARSRHIEFNISFDAFCHLIKSQCFYCGSPPSTESKNRHKREIVMLRVGVDRLNSSLGYTHGNIVPCCADCNWAKSTLSKHNFLEHITKIVRKLNADPSILGLVQHFTHLQAAGVGSPIMRCLLDTSAG